MASDITPGNIDGTFPIAGIDNDSQGFRTNFTNTSINFTEAKSEIEDLQSKSVLKAPLIGESVTDNDMLGEQLKAATLIDTREAIFAHLINQSSIVLDHQAGQYQTVTTNQSLTISAFTNFVGTVGTPILGRIQLEIDVTNTAHTLTLPSSVDNGIAFINGLSVDVITFVAIGIFVFEFSSYDNVVFTIKDLTRPSGITGTLLVDADGDTQIQIEEGADDDIIRFDTGDNITGYPAQPNALLFSSGQFTLVLPVADTATTVGGAIILTAGGGNTTGAGGALSITSGSGGATADGGALTLRSGGGGGVDDTAGDINFIGGIGGATSGTGGGINLTAGTGFVGGVINLDAGPSGTTAGDINIVAGAGTGSGAGGALVLSGGLANTGQSGDINILTSNPSGAGTAGIITIIAANAGSTSAAAGGTIAITAGTGDGSAAGGALTITAGIGGANGAGAAMTITGGAGGSASGNGGDLIIAGGAVNSGTVGDVVINSDVIHTGGQINTIASLANDATPSILGGRVWLTGGTTTITDFDDGVTGQEIVIMAEHSIIITDGTNIHLDGSASFDMDLGDTLTLMQKVDTYWYEIGRANINP